MDGSQAEPKVHRLVVTGPERDRLYEHFLRLFYGREDVVVIMDRRVAERRAGQRSAEADRRRSDRRILTPDWTVPPD
jgi:hypothetical protein